MTNIGLIGAGLMGHGIGKNLVTKGHALTVLGHRNRTPIESLMSLGAKEAKTARAVAEASDVVFICVTGSPEVEDVVYRKDGLLEGVRAGLIVADCSTAEPTSTLKIAASIAEKGGAFADTPLTRTPKEAEAGKLGVMTGGDAATLKALRPLIECFSDTIVHAGGVGSAHTLKLINNFLSISHAAVAAEAIATASKAGVDMNALKDIVMAGGAASVMFERLIKVPLADDDTAAKFAIVNAAKDLRYYAAMAQQLPAASLIGGAVQQAFMLAMAQGYGERFIPRMVNLMIDLNRGR